LRLPERDGPALYDLLMQHVPDRCPPVLFLTSESLDPASLAFLAHCGQPWLAKPCSALQIRQVIAQVLGDEDRTPQRGARGAFSAVRPGREREGSARSAPVARASEQLVLRYNPQWSDADFPGSRTVQHGWSRQDFRLVT
jgi:hypothetical protein